MSTTTQHLTTPAAPWKAPFEKHLSKMDSPEFVLSSITPNTSSSTNATPFLPRARFCIYRGMWAELPENKHNDAPKNERVYESELPTFTTDVRMEKVWDFFATGPGKASKREQTMGCGGGGPVEAVWWCKEDKIQWRIKGSAWVVARDVEGDEGNEESSGVRSMKAEVGERMRVVKEESIGSWSWGKELTGHFGNCSPGMRGSWKNPPPGTKADGEPDKDHQLGQKVNDLEDSIARDNFRVVIIKPDSVESVDLTDPAKSRRHLYTFVTTDEGGEKKGEWKEEILWP